MIPESENEGLHFPPDLLRDRATGEPLRYREGWLWAGDCQRYPVYKGIPVIQPDGLYTAAGLLHRVGEAERIHAVADEHGIAEAIAPSGAEGRQAIHAADRADHLLDQGRGFWHLVKTFTRDAPECRQGWCLDIGCGFGIDMITLCREMEFVVGIEPQLDRCVAARRLLRGMGFENFVILCGAGEELPFAQEQFQLVTANQVVEHMADRPRAFREIRRALKPGGRFVFALPSRYSLRPEPHVHLMFLGWLPRFLQDPYAKLLRNNDNYTRYTNLVSNGCLRRELRKAFGIAPSIRSGLEVHSATGGAKSLAAKVFKTLAHGPLRPILLEFEGALIGCARAAHKESVHTETQR